MKKYPNLRLAYVGTDNFEFGRALGEEIKKRRPNGGKLCIQTGHRNSPNLDLRMMGVRSVLANKIYNLPSERLNHVNGWTETSRCPLYCRELLGQAIEQFKFILARPQHEVDTFVSVFVGVQQLIPEEYRQLISPFKEKIAQQEMVIVIADTNELQLALLKAGLSANNIGQMPYEIGRQIVFTLYKIVTGEKYQELLYTPLTYCTPENYDTCTKPTNLNK